MTQAVETPQVSHVANSVVLDYPFTFTYDAVGDVKLYVDGVKWSSGYSVAGQTLTLDSAPTTGAILTIRRESPFEQTTDFVPFDAFPAETHEATLDKTVRMVQEISTEVGRAAKTPVGSQTLSLPDVDNGDALKFLRINQNGDGIEVSEVEVTNVENQTVNQFLSGRNMLINGAFNVWQRGTSFTSNGFTADRWAVSGSIALPNLLVSREPAVMSNQKYGLKKVGDATSYVNEDVVQTDLQKIENPIQHSGKSITLSVKIYSSISRTVNIGRYVSHVTGVDSLGVHQQVILDAGNNDIQVTFQPEDLSGFTFDVTSFIAYEFVWVVGAGITENTGRLAGGSTLNWSGGYIQYEEAQVEEGVIATDYHYVNTGNEVASCQQYYQVINAIDFQGYAETGAWAKIPVVYKMEMRSAPTITTVDVLQNNLTDKGVYDIGSGRFNIYLNPAVNGVCGWKFNATLDAEL